MTFSKDELQDLREYVSDGGIEDLVTIAPDHITVVSEDFPDRFFATVGLMTCTKGYGFVLMVEDCRPREDDLGFPYGCMWRVTSPHDKDRTADIYVCTTNNPKYRETLFLYERFRKMRVFTDIWQRVLVDRVGYAKCSGDCMDLSLVDFLGAKDV